MLSCEVVYKDRLQRLTGEKWINDWTKPVRFCEAYWAQKELLLLHWCVFWEGGSGILTSVFTDEGGQYFDYKLILMHSPWIKEVARKEIIDTPLTLRWHCVDTQLQDMVAISSKAFLARKVADGSIV